jgi:hypothetical protein
MGSAEQQRSDRGVAHGTVHLCGTLWFLYDITQSVILSCANHQYRFIRRVIWLNL